MEYTEDDYRAPFHRKRYSLSDLQTASSGAPLSTNFVFLITILLIVIFQFRGRILLWLDEIRIGNQSILDVIDSIRQSVSSFLSLTTTTGDNTDASSNTAGAIRRQRRLLSKDLPELEMSGDDNDEAAKHHDSIAQRKNNTKPEEIAPAFEDDKLYPSGWLVYHSKLGIVPKKEADKYCASNGE